MGPAVVLGLDLGSSRLKACTVTESREIEGTWSVRTPFAAVPGGTQMSLDGLIGALGELWTAVGAARSRVRAVGIASMGECGALLRGGDLTPLPIVAWYDPRGAETVTAIRARLGESADVSIGRHLRPATSVAKLGWLAERGYPVAGRWLSMAGLVSWLLTGVAAGEESLACTSGAYDPYERRFLEPVLRAAGLPDLTFPRPARAGDTAGLVHEAGGSWSGLPRGIPVTIAGHDHLVGAIGAGAGVADLVDSMGTGEPQLRAVTGDLPTLTAQQVGPLGLTVSRWPGSPFAAVLHESLRPGVALGRLTALLGARSAAELDAEVERAVADDGIPAADAGIGELVRALHAEDDGVQLPDAPRHHIWAWTLDHLARLAQEGADRLAAVAGAPRRMLLTGGGAASVPWVRAKRRLASVPVLVPQVSEAGGRGAALFAGVAAGWWTAPAVLEAGMPGPAPVRSADGRRG